MKVDVFLANMNQLIRESDLNLDEKNLLKDRLDEAAREVFQSGRDKPITRDEKNRLQDELSLKLGLVASELGISTENAHVVGMSLLSSINYEEQQPRSASSLSQQKPAASSSSRGIGAWVGSLFGWSSEEPASERASSSKSDEMNVYIQIRNKRGKVFENGASEGEYLRVSVPTSQYNLGRDASSAACTFNAAEAAIWLAENIDSVEIIATGDGDRNVAQQFFAEGMQSILETGAAARAKAISEAQGTRKQELEIGTEFHELAGLNSKYDSLKIPKDGVTLLGGTSDEYGLSGEGIENQLKPLLNGQNAGKPIFCTINGQSIAFLGSNIPERLFIFDPHRQTGMFRMVDAKGASDYLVNTVCAGDASSTEATFYPSGTLRR